MSKSQPKVLIIEDDEAQRESLAEWLRRKLKLHITTAETGELGLGYVVRCLEEDGNQYDAILVDQILPGIDGLETLRELKP